jgi:hypothetical protein
MPEVSVVLRSQVWRVGASPPGESGTPTTERLRRIEAKVQQMEANLGANHPQVHKESLLPTTQSS